MDPPPLRCQRLLVLASRSFAAGDVIYAERAHAVAQTATTPWSSLSCAVCGAPSGSLDSHLMAAAGRSPGGRSPREALRRRWEAWTRSRYATSRATPCEACVCCAAHHERAVSGDGVAQRTALRAASRPAADGDLSGHHAHLCAILAASVLEQAYRRTSVVCSGAGGGQRTSGRENTDPLVDPLAVGGLLEQLAFAGIAPLSVSCEWLVPRAAAESSTASEETKEAARQALCVFLEHKLGAPVSWTSLLSPRVYDGVLVAIEEQSWALDGDSLCPPLADFVAAVLRDGDAVGIGATSAEDAGATSAIEQEMLEAELLLTLGPLVHVRSEQLRGEDEEEGDEAGDEGTADRDGGSAAGSHPACPLSMRAAQATRPTLLRGLLSAAEIAAVRALSAEVKAESTSCTSASSASAKRSARWNTVYLHTNLRISEKLPRLVDKLIAAIKTCDLEGVSAGGGTVINSFIHRMPEYSPMSILLLVLY